MSEPIFAILVQVWLALYIGKRVGERWREKGVDPADTVLAPMEPVVAWLAKQLRRLGIE